PSAGTGRIPSSLSAHHVARERKDRGIRGTQQMGTSGRTSVTCPFHPDRGGNRNHPGNEPPVAARSLPTASCMALSVSLRSAADHERKHHQQGVCPTRFGGSNRNHSGRSGNRPEQHRRRDYGKYRNGGPTKIEPSSLGTEGIGSSLKH